LDLTSIEKMELFGNELNILRLIEGDLLIVEGNGSKSEIGRSALWKEEIQNCVHQNHIIRVRLSNIIPEYLDFYWNSPGGNQRVRDVAASTSGLYTLSVGKVSRMPVPLPPFSEQERIVSEVEWYLSLINQLEATVEVNLKRAERLRQSILREAFAGRLVPQDPNDEPASNLLERIRRERNGQKNESIKKRLSRKAPESVKLDATGAEQVEIWESVGN
jgi:type I restriction enzyme S subunit